MSAPTIPNLYSPHAIVLIGTDGVPYAATGGGAGGAAISAGASSQNSGTVVFSNSNGVSFGMNNGVVTATVQPGAAAGIAAVQAGTQTQTSGTAVFANSNGVTFGMSGSSQVTASVAAQSVQTQASGNIAGTGFATTTTAGSVIAGTDNTAGMTLAVPPFITTYVGQTTQPVAVSGSNGSFAFSTLTFGALNGLSFYTSNNSVVGSYTVPTTTQLVQTSASSLFQQTSATSAITSNALNTSVSTKFAGTGTTFAGTNVSASVTLNSVGLNLALSAGAGGGGGVAIANSQTTYTSGTVNLVEGGGAITIASGANQSYLVSVPATSSLAAGANITISTAGSTISIIGGTASPSPVVISAGANSASLSSIVFSNSNGVSFGLNGSTITATVATNYLTTAMASDGSSTLAGTGTTFAGANVSGSMTLNSIGLNLSLSAGAGGGGGGVAIANSQSTFTSGTVNILEGAGAITIGAGAQSLLVSVPATSSLVGVNGVSVSSNGSTISIIGGSGIPYLSYFEPADRMGAAMVYSTIPNVSSMYLTPFEVYQYLSAYRMMVIDSASTAASTLSAPIAMSESSGSTSGSVSVGHSFTVALFSRQSSGTAAQSSNLVSFTSMSRTRGFQANATTSISTNVSSATATVSTAFSMSYIANIDSAANYTTSSTTLSGSSTHTQTSTGVGTSSWSMSMTAQNVYVTGGRVFDVPLAFSLAPGEYWFGIQYSSASASTAFSHTGCISYAFAPAVLTSNPTSLYNAGVSAASQNTTNAEQGAGSVLSSLTTTTFGMTAIHQYSGWQTWFNMLADTL